MHYFFNPNRFLRYTQTVLPFMVMGAVLCLGIGLYMALVASPVDYQQGDAVRIMYVHVPAAWMALMVYSCVALSGAAALIWKNPLSDMIGKSAAPVGAGFTLICLVTGSIWGKPIWGTWWVWDARLTSMLILFFFYLGYIAIANAYDDASRAGKAAAIVALLGFINVPIVKFSVDWWNTLHQPASILRSGGVAIDPAMLKPLLLMFAGYLCYFLSLLILRVKAEVLSRKIIRLQMQNL